MSEAPAITVNPYSAPSSELQQADAGGVIADPRMAIARGYNFSIGELLSESWQKTKGVKGIIWGGFITLIGAMFGVQIALYIVGAIFGAGVFGLGAMMGGGSSLAAFGVLGFIGFTLLVTLAMLLVMYPFLGAINMVGIRQAAGQPVQFSEFFSHFGRTLPLLLTGILMVIISNIGFLLLFIPGIYFCVASVLAIPLVVERKLSAWQAIIVSCQAVNKHWFKVFFLLITMGIILFISALPFGIGLIWTLPMFIVLIGALYNRIFGVLPTAQ
jgi:uncharacterized membrane protein